MTKMGILTRGRLCDGHPSQGQGFFAGLHNRGWKRGRGGGGERVRERESVREIERER
jgi:hypothetical protein